MEYYVRDCFIEKCMCRTFGHASWFRRFYRRIDEDEVLYDIKILQCGVNKFFQIFARAGGKSIGECAVRSYDYVSRYTENFIYLLEF